MSCMHGSMYASNLVYVWACIPTIMHLIIDYDWVWLGRDDAQFPHEWSSLWMLYTWVCIECWLPKSWRELMMRKMSYSWVLKKGIHSRACIICTGVHQSLTKNYVNLRHEEDICALEGFSWLASYMSCIVVCQECIVVHHMNDLCQKSSSMNSIYDRTLACTLQIQLCMGVHIRCIVIH